MHKSSKNLPVAVIALLELERWGVRDFRTLALPPEHALAASRTSFTFLWATELRIHL
jgi:hypothetical protein